MGSSLEGKKILLGVTGGIAAYKSVLLLRLLKKAGAEVQVIMTEAACEFIRPLTLETLSENKVYVHMFEGGAQREHTSPVEHVALSQWPDLVIVAPATANTIAKLAHGRADDLLSAAILAYAGKTILSPAMNDKMWTNEALRENLRTLSNRGFRVISPGKGELACGTEGEGRMAEPEEIFQTISRIYSGKFAGLRVLVSAGRTEEDIDPVRFISNRSSGKMGFALAEAARDMGAEVTVVAGKASVRPPDGVRIIEVRTAIEMAKALARGFSEADVLIMAAAVSDYTAEEPMQVKQKADSWALKLKKTKDILSSLSSDNAGRFIIGFALETGDMEKNAMEKLVKKGCDIVVANNPLNEGAGFGYDTNNVTIFNCKGKIMSTGLKPKGEIAEMILEIASREQRFKELISNREQGRI